MIKATKNNWLKKCWYLFESKVIFPRSFKKIIVEQVPLKEGHSILLLQNHISWWDGFWGSYLAYRYFNKSYHVMVQESQLKKHFYFKYKGAFSIKKKSKELFESINYTSDLLKNPKNMVLIFPQGRLQSLYAEEIVIEKGLFRILESAPANCQVIYNAVTINYLESFKPTVKCHLFDCGNANELDQQQLQRDISAFQKKVMSDSIRQ